MPRASGSLARFLAIAVLLATVGPGVAQDDPGKNRTIVRVPYVRGLPALKMDLERRSTERYALVVGNATYEHADGLPNAATDAALVAGLLRRAGYTVAEYHDLTKKGFEAALRQALYEADYGSEFIFYYAGHGVQIGDGNYLLPTDMALGSVHDVRLGTVSLSSVMSVISSRARSVMMVIDSCRNNPFPDQRALVSLEETPRPLQTGFVASDTPINSLMVFSTSPGAVALDGAGTNSPFTKAFVEIAEANPGRPLDDLLKDVRRRVYLDTGKLQVPWSSSSLIEPLSLQLAATPGSEPVAPRRTGETMMLSANLDRKVDIGDRLSSAGSDAFVLRVPPNAGRLELRGESGFEPVQTDSRVPGERLKDLTYATQVQGAAEAGVTTVSEVSDGFKLQIGDTAHQIEVALEIDECDRQAGDHLDPEGIGFARYPNEIEPEVALAACEAAVARAPTVGRFHYQLGRAYLTLNRLDTARAEFKAAAELGHTRAYHGLGTVELAEVLSEGGGGREPAPPEAMAFFLEGVQRGDPYAYHSLGLQMLTFPETDSDRLTGYELLSRALELGHTFSMNALGLYFLEQDSDHYDPDRGLSYLTESAERGDIYGLDNLGHVALTGIGGQPVDLAAAEAWFRKAAEGGHPSAPSSLGRMYFNAQIGGRSDAAKAIEWYDIGLARGDAWGGTNAAWIIANQRPPGFTPFDAASRAAKAATMRNTEAATEALAVLDGLAPAALDGGGQQLMRDLGAEVGVDGAFGATSQAALDGLGDRHGRQFPDTPKDRVLALAKLYWENTKFRVDLY